jgi:ornithine cyclodeaminase/alanine dehydrogenase-like protein (mu-crystallin family)
MLLLSARDLRPLLDDVSQLEDAFKRIEESVLQQHRGRAGHAAWVDVPLASEELLGVYLTANPTAASVRLWDSAVRHQLHPDAQVMLLLEASDARPRALLAGRELNALRTSVPAGVGVKYLAPAGARVLGILGSGEQARAVARSFRHALPDLERIQVWSPTPANRERFAAETSQALGLPVEARPGPIEALAGANVVGLTTPPGQPEVDAAWLQPGALLVSLVGVRSPSLLEVARVVVPTSNRPTPLAIPARFQAGGGRPPDTATPPIALADVMLGRAPARDRPDQIVLFSLSAMYAWDAPIMEWAVDWATRHGVGTELDLD